MTWPMRAVRGLTDATLTLVSGIILVSTLVLAVGWILIPIVGLAVGFASFSWSGFAVWLILSLLCWAFVVEIITNFTRR